MKENFKNEVLEVRKKKLGLDIVNTELVLSSLLNYYKEQIIKEKQNVMDLVLDIALSNMNGYNKLGNVEDLYYNWGDYYYIDFNNSCFVKMIVEENGAVETEDEISFSDIVKLKDIKNISFSLKELINLCKKLDIKVEIYTKDDYNYTTILEITVLNRFDNEDKNINCYLKSIV